MITFRQGDCRFNYRVAAVLIHQERVLVHRAEADGYWTLPGGHCEMPETAPTTLRREFREELGVDITVERLLWVGENFFTYAGERYHELGLYFEACLAGEHPLYRREGDFPGAPGHEYLRFRWAPLADLNSLPLMPEPLRACLSGLPGRTGYFVAGTPERGSDGETPRG